MDVLMILALVVLIILLLAVIGVWAALAVAPGRIARSRNHPKAESIAVCGYWGAITLGLLTPLAFIWAYSESNAGDTTQIDEPEEPEEPEKEAA